MEMDVLEEVEISENQISFDFLNEDKSSDTQIQQSESFDWVAEETLVLIVRSDEYISPNFELCGKRLQDWVAMATFGCKQIFVDDLGDELIDSIRPYADGYNYVAVLYSDTPLLRKETFLELMTYFSKNRMNFMKLRRGFVFKADFLKTARVLLSSNVEEFGKEDFVVLNDAEKISFAFKVLNSRILGYHKKNGVVLLGEETIFVDADVEIEAGVKIFPNNVIKGESYIGKNAVLESGNYIIDTIICDEAFVCQSYLEKSKVEQGKVVGPFTKLINQKI